MSTNPFEPPRTSDLEGGDGPGALVLSEAALQELAASAGWVRWFARFAAISLAVGIVEAVVTLFSSGRTVGSAGSFISLSLGTAVSIAYLTVLRRYAAAAERLRAGARQAAAEVISAQASYFKLSGVMTIIALVLIVLVFVIGLAAGLSAARRF